MNNEELLSAISELIEVKILPEIPRQVDRIVEKRLAPVEAEIRLLKAEVAELKADVAELKADVAELKTEVAELKVEVAELKTDVAELKTEVAELKADVADLQERVGVLETQYIRLSVVLESQVLPQLHDMQKCYSDTFQRYAGSSEVIENLQSDMVIVKNVVREHSVILDRIG